MSRLPRLILNALTVPSLLLCVAVLWIWSSMGIDCDVAIFWGTKGKLICFDTFEDAGSLTLNVYSDWPTSVPLQCREGCVEAGSEVPAIDRTSGSPRRLWVDTLGQPATRNDPAASLSSPLTVRRISKIPLAPTLWIAMMVPLGRLAAHMTIRRRQATRKNHVACVQCGYSLTGNVSGICPECGTKAT